MDVVKDLVAGTVGGVAGLFVGQPLDVLRVRAQTTWVGQPGTLLGRVSDMVRREGVLSLYKGVVPPMLGVGAQNAVLFVAYGSAIRIMSGDSGKEPGLAAVTLAGSIGGFACGFVTGPVELLKCQQQVNEVRGGVGTATLIRTMVGNEGFFGVFRGLAATMCRDVPSYGIYFWSYELIRRWYARSHGMPTADVPGLVNFVAGGIGGSLSWAAIYPIDVVKSRLQVVSIGGAQEGVLQCARRIYAQEGPQVFVRGLGLTLGRAFPVNAAIFYFYELTIKLLNMSTA